MPIRIVVDPIKGLYQELSDSSSSFDVDAGVTTTGISGGGGGGTVIEDGGTLSGTYEGDVLCLGAASLTASVIVQGKLIVLGNLTNNGGWALTVKGDLVAQDLEFNRSDLSLAQSNITVDGNMTIHNIDFRQGASTQAVLRIGGNFVSSYGASGGYIQADGYNAPGATITVYGNMSGFVTINLNGADASLGVSGEGFQGGNLAVYGDLILIDGCVLSSTGGDGDTYSNGAQGGTIYVYGDMIGENSTIELYGGDATDFSAGNGGVVECGGDCIVWKIDTRGGNASYGGFLSGLGGNGGNGGNITVFGNLNFNDSITVNGGIGRGEGNNGGAAGNITVYGDVVGADTAIIEGQGGQCRGNQSGNASNFTVYGNVLCYDIDFSGGTWVTSDGSSTNIVGGAGGFVNVYGDLTIKGSLYTSGGNARSTSKSGYAGNGGSVNALSLYVDSTLDTSGGTRSGTTTEANLGGGAGATGGNISVARDMQVYEFDNSGGDVTTTYKTRTGGNAGNVTVDGNMKIEYSFTSNGGNSVGLNGGNAGQVNVAGATHCIGTMYLVGGNSNDSAGGDLAGTNGHPQDCYFEGGVSIEEIQYKDGSGTGDPPSTDNVLRIGSNCFIKQIDATDRAGIKIQPSNAYPATLKINQMVTKTTLNKSDGTATAALFNPNQKIFATGYDVGTGITSWYSFVGFELV